MFGLNFTKLEFMYECEFLWIWDFCICVWDVCFWVWNFVNLRIFECDVFLNFSYVWLWNLELWVWCLSNQIFFWLWNVKVPGKAKTIMKSCQKKISKRLKEVQPHRSAAQWTTEIRSQFVFLSKTTPTAAALWPVNHHLWDQHFGTASKNSPI